MLIQTKTKNKNQKVRKDLVYPELSYKIIGIAFRVYNELGYNYKEKYIQRAFASELKNQILKYEKEKCINICYNNKRIGKHFLDFIVMDKILVEIKMGEYFKVIHLKQVLQYLKTTKLKLGLIIYFTKNGIKYKRIINPNI